MDGKMFLCFAWNGGGAIGRRALKHSRSRGARVLVKTIHVLQYLPPADAFYRIRAVLAMALAESAVLLVYHEQVHTKIPGQDVDLA
jgi:hypothetical protein